MLPPLHVFDDPDAWTRASVDFLADALAAGQAERSWASLALSGGSTPPPVYRALADDDRIDWQRVRVYFCDDRCVPPDHEHSNARLAREHLMRPADIPDDHVFQMAGTIDPDEAARQYDALLREHFGGPPRFDAAVLGMGDDGHTCSLFPGSPALAESDRLCLHTISPPGMVVDDRLTLTYPALAGIRHALFLVKGASKREPLRNALRGQNPAGRVTLTDGDLRWHVDRAAAPTG
jgi:6-phosphogluconolactonase